MRYPCRDLPLPLELLNTSFALAGQPVDALATPDDLDAWLQANAAQFAIRPPSASPALLRKFRRLRTALQQLFGPLVDGGEPPATSSAAVKRVNALSSQTRVFPWLEVRHGTYAKRTADGSQDASLAAVARASIELLAGPDVERLARCQAPNCVLFFLREGRRREWCSEVCGNRARVARHYLRHRSRASGTPPGMRLGPRLVVAGTHSGVGKTTVATGLMAALRSARPQGGAAPKSDPTSSIPGYHALACGRPGRNLDAWLCGPELARAPRRARQRPTPTCSSSKA